MNARSEKSETNSEICELCLRKQKYFFSAQEPINRKITRSEIRDVIENCKLIIFAFKLLVARYELNKDNLK